jgi:hypothetical protein
MTPKHEAARHYAAKGWPVFPVEGKVQPLFTHWQLRATTDLYLIDEWWKLWPEANPALVPELAGMCVVDEDLDKGGVYDCPNVTFTVKTPHGRHHYYAGSLPPTVGKIGEHVDTRGINSYVLLPGSTTPDGEYTWETDEPDGAWDLLDVPEWVVEKCKPAETDRRTRTTPLDGNAEDKPQSIARFQHYLENNPPPPEGAGSDDATYRAIARGRDLGLTDETIRDMIWDAAPGYDRDWIEEKLGNVERYQQNEPGCDAPSMVIDFAEFAEKFGGNRQKPNTSSDGSTQREDRSSRFKAQKPSAWLNRPPIVFYDDAEMLPQIPGGAVGVLYGESGHHKTNVILTKIFDAIADWDIHVIYVAGEGVYGLARDRVWAHATAREMTQEWVDTHLGIVEHIPDLTDPVQVQEFVSINADFKPAIVVVDTLATATPGVDENSKIIADILSDNGAAGIIKEGFGGACVIFIAHQGKDEAKGLRGHSGQRGNIDFLLHGEFDGKTAITLLCEKMRDGRREGHSEFFQIEPTGVPVPKQISPAEHAKMFKQTSRAIDDDAIPQMAVKSFLVRAGHHTWELGLETPELAHAMVEEEYGLKPDTDDEDWLTHKARWRKKLHNGRTRSWGKKCTDERIQKGGKEMTLRWFCAPEGQIIEEEY